MCERVPHQARHRRGPHGRTAACARVRGARAAGASLSSRTHSPPELSPGEAFAPPFTSLSNVSPICSAPQADGALCKRWSEELTSHPLHATLQNNPNPDLRTPECDAQTAEALFPVGSTALCLSANYYGQPAEVLDHQDDTMVRPCALWRYRN